MRSVTIHSDGTGRGTIVLDEEGKPIADISSLDLNVDAGGFVEVSITILKANINIQGSVKEVNFTCPLCGEMYDHQCDPNLGGSMASHPHSIPALPRCQADAGVGVGGQCIREANHDKKHFDGVIAWGNP